MFSLRLVAASSALAILGACGGGGDSGGGSPPVQIPITIATLPVTLSAPSADVTVAEGQSADFGFTATYSGTSTQPIVADVMVGSDRFQLVGTPTANGQSFNVPLRTVPLSPGGKSASTVTFRLCTTASCGTIYPGSTQTFTVNLDVQLKDWSTFQRDAAHSGYVAANYTTANFAEAWSIPTTRPVKGIAARRGTVFYNVVQDTERLVTRAINSANGQLLWQTELGTGFYFSAPAFANGRVVSMAMDLSSQNVPMLILDAADGRVRGALHYDSQFSYGGVPTPVGDDLFFQAGYYGNVVFGNKTATWTRSWRTDTTVTGRGFVSEGQSVAADENSIYYFGGGDLVILNRVTGTITRRIANPYFSKFDLSYKGSYDGGPLLAGNGRIVTFTDNRELHQAQPLVAFDAIGTQPLWRTSASYGGQPALRDGRIYATRRESAIVDIIDAATGNVVSSIDLGADKEPLRSNIVLTGSHMFVASDKATYAIDLRAANPAIVWTAPKGGNLAITPDNLLVISADNGISAYRLA